MNYWLIKSEGDCYSVDDLQKDTEKKGFAPWSGVRNFQARNHLRAMKPGDLLLFYHSKGKSTAPAGVYGIAKVVKEAHLDMTALDPKDEYYDSKAVEYKKAGKEPLWVCPDVAFVKKLRHPVSLEMIKASDELEGILVARRGQRLSVMPVAKEHFDWIVRRGNEEIK